VSHVNPPEGWEFEHNPEARMPEGWVGIRQNDRINPLVIRFNLHDRLQQDAARALLAVCEEHHRHHHCECNHRCCESQCRG
jgi:hypothetical protein